MGGLRAFLGASVFLCSVFGTLSCRPSASVRRTTPVANLQSYRSALLRVAVSGREGEAEIPRLEQTAANLLRTKCQFDQVLIGEASSKPDLIVDLNIQRSFRGGEGIVQNPNLAIVDVTMVLSDGINDELIGSVDIRGQSSAVLMGGQPPESQAVDAVASKIAEVMAKSGCHGPRVARAPDDPGPTDPGPDDPGPGEPGVDPAKLAEAEKLNDEGKEMFRSANITGAKAKFEQAIAITADGRFLFNLCLAQETLKEYPAAEKTCQQVIDMNAGARLTEKAKERLTIIAEKKGGS